MQLAHQQRVIAIIYRDGHYRRAVDVHRRAQGRLQRLGAFHGKPFRAEGFGIGFKIHRPELDAGQALVFFLFLDSDHVVAVIDPDKMQHVGFQADGGLQLHARLQEAAVAGDGDHFALRIDQPGADGPGQGDRLFDWLATAATLDDMKWFLTQEAAGEAGFDDLVAYSQIKVPVAQAKLELARNYWDEMGRGNEGGMPASPPTQRREPRDGRVNLP